MPIESKKGSQLPTNESPAKKVWLIGFSEENSESVKYPLADLINKFEEGYIIPGKANGLTPESDEAQRIEEAETLIQGLELTKANKSGAYPMMQVGLADNLVSPDGVTDAEPYFYRTTAGSASVATGVAQLQSVKGNTLVSNQLIPSNFFTTGTWSNYNSSTANSLVDGWRRMTKKEGSSVSGNIRIVKGFPFAFDATHRYYISVEARCSISDALLNVAAVTTGSSSQSTSLVTFSNVGTTAKRFAAVSTALETAENRTYIRFGSATGLGEGTYFEFRDLMVIDLTRMFGAGKEPTADEFNALYPHLYYAYNAGELINMQADKLETVGFNAYNHATKTAELIGGLTPDDGQAGTYQITGAYTSLSYECTNGATETITPDANGFFTPVNSGVLTVTGGNATNTCIHLVWSGYRNGEYESYKRNELDLSFIKSIQYNGSPLFPDGLCSAGSVYDEITSTKAIKRVGVREHQAGDEDDTAITTDGTYTNYPLATQIEVEFDEPLNLTYQMDDFGTERVYPYPEYDSTQTYNAGDCVVYNYTTYRCNTNATTGTWDASKWDMVVTSPFAHSTFYMNNLRDKIRNIDGNTNAAALMVPSLDNLLSTLGTALNGTLTKTWDTTDKCWTFSFTPNTPE